MTEPFVSTFRGAWRIAVMLCVAWAAPMLAQAQTAPKSGATRLRDMSLEDLMQLKVVTASRVEERLTRSTSTISVITARDIERAGFRTVYDVLARVPGFFPTTQATWQLVGTRGLVSDGNDHILLLVDGHAQNSIVSHGYQQQDQIPALEKVERIEIIRGPGSVQWGASAAHAIINIVTKDRLDDGETVAASAGYAGGDGLATANVLQNIDFGTANGLLSASYWRASGYNAPSGPNVKFPWGASTNLWPALGEQRPGFEVYLKLKDGDRQQLLARVTQTSVTYPWDSWSYDPSGGVRPGSELRMRKAYVDYQNSHRYGARLKVDYNVYGDMLLQNRFPLALSTPSAATDSAWMEDQSREELAFGVEAAATYEFSARHTLRLGTKYVHTIAGPNRGFRFDTETNLPTVPARGQDQVPVIDVPSGTDNNVAVYSEDRLSLNGGRTDLFAGARVDYNDWRERRTVVLPRAGIVHSLSDALTAKYVFNTGYLRPNAAYSKSGGKFYRAPSKTIEDVNVVDRGERVVSHDVQLTFERNRHYVAVTGFYMTVDDFITWETRLDLGYRDMGEAYSRGAEVEARYFLDTNLSLTGNYSYARGYLRSIPTGLDVNGVPQLLDGAVTNANREWLNYPHHVWNLGADYVLRTRQSFNVNLRGWQTMNIVTPFDAARPGTYDTLAGQIYLDANYVVKNLFGGVDGRLTIGNLFDNVEPVGMVINNGVFHPRGRNIAFQLTKRF